MPPQKTSEPIRLLLVDDHEVVRVGLKALLSRTKTIQVVGEAGTAAEAVAKASQLKPDVVMMDLRLPDSGGMKACRDIRSSRPDTRVLFLTSYADEAAITATLLGGAQGYLLKEIGGEALVRAITAVAEGQSVLEPSVTQPVLARMQAGLTPGAPSQGLSPQEQRVLALVAEGKTNKEVAAGLHLSEKTVRNYLSHIFEKLQITSRTQAAAFYLRQQS